MSNRPNILLRTLFRMTYCALVLQVSACGPSKRGGDSDKTDAGRDASGPGGDGGTGGTIRSDSGVDRGRTGGTEANTGGAVSSTGGAVSSTGGAVSSTGGVVSSTGGVVSSTGGVVSSTGGVVSSTGGVAGNLGGDAGVLGEDGDSCGVDGDCSSGLSCCDDICRAACQPLCGNGSPDTGEECDEGARNSDEPGAACRIDCLFARCGDLIVDDGEECDEGAQNSDEPGAACRIDCLFARCGDLIVDDGEECDDGDQNSDTTADACRTDCRAFGCGDRQKDTGESCDDGNDVDLDGCSGSCTLTSHRLLPTLARSFSAWVDVAVSPHGGNRVYALDERGMVHVSVDGGNTTHALCLAPTAGAREIILSAATDRTAYVVGKYLYEIEPMAGEPCRRLPIGADDNLVLALAVSPSSGDLHVWDEAFIWSVSDDLGRTWTRRDHGMISAGSEYVNATVDPTDNDNILLVREGSGLYHRTDGSGTFAAVPTGTFSAVEDSVGFDPLTSGLVYSNAGFVSTDGGGSWNADGRYAMSGDWALDEAGRGYRLVAGATTTVLERASDMSAPVWSAIETFAGTSTIDRVSAFGSTVAVVVDRGLQVSVDDGQSFTAIWHEADFHPVSIASVDGQTIHAATADWTFFRSTNAGARWTRTYQARGLREAPEILVNPADSEHIFVHATGTSVYERQIVVSHDGMDTAVTSEAGAYGWATTAGQSLTNPDLLYNIGWTGSHRSLDAGDTFSPLAATFDNVWYPSQAFINPLDDDVLWVADRGVLYEYQHAANTFLDVTSRLGTSLAGDSVAGLRVLDAGQSNYKVMAIGREGHLAVSDDLTQTFLPVGDAPGSCSSSSWRFLEVAPGNPDVIATACYNSSGGAAVSTDGGSSWVDVTQSADWSLYGCRVLDLTMTQSNTLFACSGQAGLAVPFVAATCGNGQVEIPEACDEGSAANSNAPDSSCRTDCTLGRCGDGIQDGGEQCDDGDNDDADGCTSFCSLCGNQVVTVPEGCDEGPSNSAAPDATCRLDCRSARCGDGTKDSNEVCDDGNVVGGDGCRADCMGVEDCGDGLQDNDAGEECDLANANSDSAVDGCRTNCRTAYCGDGIVDTGETCEGGVECSANCLADYLVEPLCDGLNDDDDQIVDEGCAGTPPSTPLVGWVPFDFAFYDYKIGCSGQRYVAETMYTNAPFVGVIVCSDSRYKIMLSETLDGTFYSIGDGSGSGQDHCEFVGGVYSTMDSSNNSGEPGFRRSSEGDEPTFGTMGGAHYTATWYECGITIP